MVARESVNELAIVGTACTNIHKTTECSRWSRTKNATQTAATDLVYMQRRRSAPDKKPVAALRGSEISRRPESHKKRTVRLAV